MFQGKRFSVLTASLTPLDQNLGVDYDHLGTHVHWLLKRGATGVVLMGTTGEANSLSTAERKHALDAVLDAGVDPHQLMVGTGCCALTDTVDLTEHAVEAGVQSILVIPPFYYKNVSEDGLFAAYDYLLQSIGSRRLRLYLYHFPKMSATPITPGLVERLLHRYPGSIAGFKDSSGNWNSILEMIRNFPEIQVFAGSEQFLLETLRAGGAGCISAAANVTSPLTADLAGKWETPESDILQRHIHQIRKAVEQWPMIAALKVLMQHLTGRNVWMNLRPPLSPLSPDEANRCIELYESVSTSATHSLHGIQ